MVHLRFSYFFGQSEPAFITKDYIPCAIVFTCQTFPCLSTWPASNRDCLLLNPNALLSPSCHLYEPKTNVFLNDLVSLFHSQRQLFPFALPKFGIAAYPTSCRLLFSCFRASSPWSGREELLTTWIWERIHSPSGPSSCQLIWKINTSKKSQTVLGAGSSQGVTYSSVLPQKSRM